MAEPLASVFIVTYRSPYPEDGDCWEIVGVARTYPVAQQLAIDQIRTINARSPITDLDHYTITEMHVAR